jgi:N-acetylneuraminic acid mutarotase
MYFCPMPHRFALLSLLCCVGLSAFHAQSWEPFASVPNGFVSDHSFGFALNGAGYLVAGQTPDGFSDNMFRYDPVTDTWSTLPDFPGPARGYTIGDTWSGEAWMGFGLGNDGPLNDLWKYDPATTSWTEMASCPCEARYHPAFVAMDGHIYMGLGSNYSGDLGDWWDYDMATNSWSQKPDLPASPRHHPYQFGLDGLVYTGFGHSGEDIFNTWYAYDPSAESWSEMAELPGQGRVAGTQFSHNGLGFALSGDGESHSSMDEGEFWAYDPASDAWSQWPSHPGWSRWAPASFVIEDVVYFMQGTTTDPSSDLYVSTNFKFSLVPTAANDVAVDGYLGELDGCGDGSQPIVAQIRNCGAPGFIDINLSMIVDGNEVLSQPWSGTLASYETAGVVLGSYDTSDLESFDLVINEVDENLENNAFNVEALDLNEAYLTCTVTLITDAWGEETGWAILDQEGNEIIGAPAGTYASNQSYSIDVTLPAEGCYEVILTDTYGDGMVGNFGSGPGSFALTSFEIPGNPFTDFPVFEYDGGFEFSELRQPFRAAIADVNAVADLPSPLRGRVYPNPVQNVLTLEWKEALMTGVIEVFNAWGQPCSKDAVVHQNRLDIPTESWLPGVYLVRSQSNFGTETWRILKR